MSHPHTEIGNRTLRTFERHGGVRNGHFRVPAGHHTAQFWEKFAVLQAPAAADRLFADLAGLLAEHEPTAVAGPSQGGMLVAWGVARHLGCRALFLERETRDGPFVIGRGTRVEADERVVLVDDLVSSGRTLGRATRLLTSLGVPVRAIGVLIDRRRSLPPAEVTPVPPVTALLELDGPPNWRPADCPMCARNEPLLDPRASVSG